MDLLNMDIEDALVLLLASPESVVKLIKENIDKYKPHLYAIINEIFEVYKDYVDNDKFFATVAKLKMQYLTAYCNAGFTREEAMTFIHEKKSSPQVNDLYKLVTPILKKQSN